MPVSESKRKNNDKYNMKCDFIAIKPLKPVGEKIRETARSSGMSLQGFILDAIDQRISEIENGREYPEQMIPNAIDWLKGHGHNDEEVLDFLNALKQD